MDTLQASSAFEPETTRQGFVRFWEMMAPVCYRADEGHRDAIWKEVQEGRVWAFLHTDAGALACIEDRPTGTSDVCVFTYGGLADALDEVLGDVEAFARGRGCVGICIQADAKAGRGFAGFDPVSVCLRRDLA